LEEGWKPVETATNLALQYDESEKKEKQEHLM
jgi:hypothetical protein